ncbi:MAG: hypothetical protein U0470_02165 [Anaerolineae bacterium]
MSPASCAPRRRRGRWNAAAFVAPGIVAVADGPAGLVVVVGLERAASGAPLVLARLGDTGDARALAVADDIVYLAGRRRLGDRRRDRTGAPRGCSAACRRSARRTPSPSCRRNGVRRDGCRRGGGGRRRRRRGAAAARADRRRAGRRRLAADGGQVYAAVGEHGLVVIDAATRTVRALATPGSPPGRRRRGRHRVCRWPDGRPAAGRCAGPVRPALDGGRRAVPGVDGDFDARPSAVAHAAGRVYVAARAAGVVVVTAAIGRRDPGAPTCSS